VVANFPDQYLQLNGWLTSLGVSAVFDVSFGAELCAKSYAAHIRRHSPQVVIYPAVCGDRYVCASASSGVVKIPRARRQPDDSYDEDGAALLP